MNLEKFCGNWFDLAAIAFALTNAAYGLQGVQDGGDLEKLILLTFLTLVFTANRSLFAHFLILYSATLLSLLGLSSALFVLMRVLETLIGEQSLGDTFISSVEATFVLTPLLIGLFLGVLMKKADSQHNESRQLFRSFEWLYWALSTGAISIFATNEYGLFNYDGDPIATRFVYSFLAVNIVAPATIAAAMNFYQWRKSLV